MPLTQSHSHRRQTLLSLFPFLNTLFHHLVPSYVHLSLCPNQQLTSNYFFPTDTKFGISGTVTWLIFILCDIPDTVTWVRQLFKTVLPKRSLALPPVICGVWPCLIQLPRAACEMWPSFLAPSVTSVSISHCYLLCSTVFSCQVQLFSCPVQFGSPQARAQSVLSSFACSPNSDF